MDLNHEPLMFPAFGEQNVWLTLKHVFWGTFIPESWSHRNGHTATGADVRIASSENTQALTTGIHAKSYGGLNGGVENFTGFRFAGSSTFMVDFPNQLRFPGFISSIGGFLT